MTTMLAARLHQYGSPMTIDRIPVPEVRPTDVLVEVRACGVVPNLERVINNFFSTQGADAKGMPRLPAIFGLDPAGVISQVGAQVRSLRVGDRVYVNPARTCGSCRMCRMGDTPNCAVFTFQGYFGRSSDIMADYPYGGLCQFITAPASAIVQLPDTMRFASAARFGYLGTAYSALKKLQVGPGQTLLINGISGTLGLCAALLALAMGATRILGTGRNAALLDQVKALAPDRIQVIALEDDAAPDDRSLAQWANGVTNGEGVDGMIDCMPPGAPAGAMMRALFTLRRGGRAANVGAIMETLPLNAFWLMTNRITLMGSVWFTTAEGEEMAGMAAAGTLNLDAFEDIVAPLSQVNEVIAGGLGRHGGFSNWVVDPSREN